MIPHAHGNANTSFEQSARKDRVVEDPWIGGHLAETQRAAVHGMTTLTRCFSSSGRIGLTTRAIGLRLSADPLGRVVKQ